jgi:hypothetical protein
MDEGHRSIGGVGHNHRWSALSATGGIYAGAALSFIAGILRDGAALTLVDSGQRFFQMMYFASLSSIWGINFIQLGTSPPLRRHVERLILLSAIALATCWVMLPCGSPLELATVLSALVMWTIGSVASRAQLASGRALSSRAREAVSSVAIALLLLAGLGSMPSIAVGVAIGTIWMLKMSWGVRANYFGIEACPRGSAPIIRGVFISNAAIGLMTLWAIYVNQHQGTIFGFPAPLAARFSSYLFQAISIGWMVVAVRSGHLPNFVVRHGALIAAIFFGLGLMSTALSIATSCIAMPLLAGLGQYTLIAAGASQASPSRHHADPPQIAF